MNVQKAGTVLLDLNNRKIGLVYRNKLKDYSFPKGHLEPGETLEECAVRETEEETGRICSIISSELPVLNYIDSNGNNLEVHHYLAKDEGISSKVFPKEDVEELIWVYPEDVEHKLSYPSLIKFWNEIKCTVYDVFEI